MMRTALYEAAHVVLLRMRKWSSLKAWGMRIVRPDFNSDFQNIYLTQQVTLTALVVSTTIPGFQAACSRMLGVRATPAYPSGQDRGEFLFGP